jgi:transposase
MPAIAAPLVLTDEDRARLGQMARQTSLPHRAVTQAKALLWAGEGVANAEIARRCGVDPDAVRSWRKRFAEKGVDGVGVIAKGRGRKPWLPEGTVEAVVHDTLHATPDDGSTHWTTRLMAKRFGIGKDAVARIWRDHELKPWKVGTFKLSADHRFEEKLVDVVGLYLQPPAKAVVFSFVDKTQVQALDRTQPSLPMVRGRANTMTHDYKRNGTTDLFAALNIATGEVLTECRPPTPQPMSWRSSSRSTAPSPGASTSTSCWTISPPTKHPRSPSGSPSPASAAGISTSRRHRRRG